MLDKKAKGIIAEGTTNELKQNATDPRVRSFFLREAPEESSQDKYYVR
jgi:phospholipid/cholesterol/gamma-HCH transport system ATP-binding protein